MDSLLATEGKAAVTDERDEEGLRRRGQADDGEQEVRARHILVETEDEAKAIVAELKKGADFAELAKEKSKDPGSRRRRRPRLLHQGPDGAGILRGRLQARKGEVSDPVKSQFGWHIIKVEDKRDRKPPAFDKVKDQLETFVVRKAQADYSPSCARTPRSSGWTSRPRPRQAGCEARRCQGSRAAKK